MIFVYVCLIFDLFVFCLKLLLVFFCFVFCCFCCCFVVLVLCSFFHKKYGQLNTLHLLNHNSNLSEIDIQCRTCFCYTMKSTSGFIASSIRSST